MQYTDSCKVNGMEDGKRDFSQYDAPRNFRCPEKLWRRFQRWCEKQDATTGEVLRNYVEQCLRTRSEP